MVVARDSLPWELWRRNDSYCSLTCMEPSLSSKRQHPNESNKALSWTLRNHSDIDFSRYANHQKYSSTTKEFRIKISTVIHERLGRETGERERERGRERERRAVASVKKKNCNCKNILVKLWLSCEETKEGGERKRNRQNKFDCTEMKWRPSPLFFLLSPLAFAFAFALQVSGLPLASTDITQSWSHGPFIRVVGLSPSLAINSSLSVSLSSLSLNSLLRSLLFFLFCLSLFVTQTLSLSLSLSRTHTHSLSLAFLCAAMPVSLSALNILWPEAKVLSELNEQNKSWGERKREREKVKFENGNFLSFFFYSRDLAHRCHVSVCTKIGWSVRARSRKFRLMTARTMKKARARFVSSLSLPPKFNLIEDIISFPLVMYFLPLSLRSEVRQA